MLNPLFPGAFKDKVVFDLILCKDRCDFLQILLHYVDLCWRASSSALSPKSCVQLCDVFEISNELRQSHFWPINDQNRFVTPPRPCYRHAIARHIAPKIEKKMAPSFIIDRPERAGLHRRDCDRESARVASADQESIDEKRLRRLGPAGRVCVGLDFATWGYLKASCLLTFKRVPAVCVDCRSNELTTSSLMAAEQRCPRNDYGEWNRPVPRKKENYCDSLATLSYCFPHCLCRVI